MNKSISNKHGIAMYFCFIIIGIVAMAVTIFELLSNINFTKTSKEANAVVKQIFISKNSSSVYVEFKVDGKVYSGSLNGYDRKIREGGVTEIKYNPQNPSEFIRGDAVFASFMKIRLGLFFLIVGIILMIKQIKKNKMKDELKSTLQPIMAQVKSVDLDRTISHQGRNPFTLTCVYINPMDNKAYFFKEEQIWYDIKTIIDTKDIKELPVYVDLQNPEKYIIDLDSLE